MLPSLSEAWELFEALHASLPAASGGDMHEAYGLCLGDIVWQNYIDMAHERARGSGSDYIDRFRDAMADLTGMPRDAWDELEDWKPGDTEPDYHDAEEYNDFIDRWEGGSSGPP